MKFYLVTKIKLNGLTKDVSHFLNSNLELIPAQTCLDACEFQRFKDLEEVF